MAALLGVCAISFTIQAFQFFLKPKEIAAEKFILGSEKGKPYAIFGLAKDGSPSLAFMDGADHRRVLFGLMPKAGNSPALILTDENGNIRMSVGLLEDGSPGILLHGPDDKLRAGVRVDPDGTPKIETMDKLGNTVWKSP